MADKYVDPDNGGDGAAGTVGDPYKTIEKAIAQVGSGNTIHLMEGTYDTTTQGANWKIFFSTDSKPIFLAPYNSATITLLLDYGPWGIGALCDDSTFTFTDITINGDSCGDLIYRYANKNASFVFNNCTITNTGGTETYLCNVQPSTVAAGSFTFSDCDIDAYSIPFLIKDVTTLDIQDCTIDSPIQMQLRNVITNLIFDNNVLTNTSTSNGYGLYLDSNFAGGSHLRVVGNTFNCQRSGVDISYPTLLDTIYVADNTISVAHSSPTSGIAFGLDFSSFVAWATATGYVSGNQRKNDGQLFECVTNHTSGDTDDEPGTGATWRQYWKLLEGAHIVCNNNTVTFSTTGQVHALFIAAMCNDGEYGHNNISGGDYQIVCKGAGNYIHHNVAYGPKPMAIFSNGKNKIINNVIYATADDALLLGAQDGNFTSKNVILNNIIYATDDYCLSDNGNAADGQEYVDYNCYYRADAGDVFYLGSSARADLAAMITQWQSQNICFGYVNDVNSIVGDPLFVDAANNNFRLQVTSPCFHVGTPTLNSGFLSMGTWQRKQYPLMQKMDGVL